MRPMLSRRPLREDIYQALLERLLEGDPEPGSHINEQALCVTLGVSRTPLREALIRLEQDGFLRSDMARGFTVQPLSATEIRDVYPIMWALESLAVRLSGAEALLEAVPDLRRILQEMEAVDAAGFALVEDLDIKWHARMRAGCENEKLQEMVTLFRRLIRRYEFAYMRDLALRGHSINQHRQMLEAIEAASVDDVARLIEEHWRFGMEQDLARLDRDEISSGAD